MWIEPIIDRTEADLAEATLILDTIRENGYDSLTTEQQTAFLNGFKACLTYQTLNRIENNMDYLRTALNELGYNISAFTTKTDWGRTDLPTQVEADKILNNANNMVSNTYPVEITLPTSLQYPTYENINVIESLHLIMYNRLVKIQNSYTYCGTTYCG